MNATTALWTIKYDATEETYQWDVLDDDGDVMDSFESKAEAEACVRELEAEYQSECDLDEAGELAELISERLNKLDLDAIKAVARFMKLI